MTNPATLNNTDTRIVPKQYLFPFALLTICFASWGLANNMTDSLVRAFSSILEMSTLRATLVQSAFYGAYFCLAIPAAIIIRKYSYKTGVLAGLGLFIIGALLFYPASQTMNYWHFIIAIYILASGLSILETSANPYIIAMGPEETATRRLNFAQSFNPIGSIIGVILAKTVILAGLSTLSPEERLLLTPDERSAIRYEELEAVMGPYVFTAFVLLAIWCFIAFSKMPRGTETTGRLDVQGTLKRLLANKHYSLGVIAQFFYIGAQIGVWTFVIFYVEANLGLTSVEAGNWLIASIVVFSFFRFVCTFLMKYFRPSFMLAGFAFIAIILSLICMMVSGHIAGALAAVAISACMSLMFPTIYGIALQGLGEDSKIGAAGLVMAIVGGAILTPIQGYLVDAVNVNISFIVPLICFVMVMLYGIFDLRSKRLI